MIDRSNDNKAQAGATAARGDPVGKAAIRRHRDPFETPPSVKALAEFYASTFAQIEEEKRASAAAAGERDPAGTTADPAATAAATATTRPHSKFVRRSSPAKVETGPMTHAAAAASPAKAPPTATSATVAASPAPPGLASSPGKEPEPFELSAAFRKQQMDIPEIALDMHARRIQEVVEEVLGVRLPDAEVAPIVRSMDERFSTEDGRLAKSSEQMLLWMALYSNAHFERTLARWNAGEIKRPLPVFLSALVRDPGDLAWKVVRGEIRLPDDPQSWPPPPARHRRKRA